MSVDIIDDALKYYDANNEKYRNIKKRIKFYTQVPNKSNVESVKLVFYDQNMKEIFISRIEILGKFYKSINTWVWGWGLPDLNKSATTIIRKVFLYGTDINPHDADYTLLPANVMLKNELVTSRFRIEDEIQVDIHCAIASYLAKKPFILRSKKVDLNPITHDNQSESKKSKTDVIFFLFIIDPPTDI